MVGTARCAVRAKLSGKFRTAQRAVPTNLVAIHTENLRFTES